MNSSAVTVSENRIHLAVIKVRNAVKEQIKPLSLDQLLEYLALLTMEIKALRKNNQSQRSRKGSKGRLASLSH